MLVFADRMEVWNPRKLPPGLTPELLREPHGPIPRNPLIAEPLFRVQHVEKAKETGQATHYVYVKREPVSRKPQKNPSRTRETGRNGDRRNENRETWTRNRMRVEKGGSALAQDFDLVPT